MAGMNAWLVAGSVLLLGLIPCGIAVSRGKPVERLVALEMASIETALAVLLFAKGFNRPSFIDLALTLALLSIPGSLLFVHYMERWR